MALPAPPGRFPVEAKTQAAGVAGVVSGALIWILQTYVFKGAVDPGLVSLIYAAVPGVLAFGAAYLAPHTSRPIPSKTTMLPGNVTITSAQKPLTEAEAAQFKQELEERIGQGGTA